MAKFKRIDTGEVVNVVSWGANGTYTDYYDSKGKFHHTDLNRYNHFEEIIESSQSALLSNLMLKRDIYHSRKQQMR